LSLVENESTNLSQHETLGRLSKVKNANVSYVCAMLFDLDEIYETPDVNALQIMDVATAPTTWTNSERHFIMFQTQDDANPQWCSAPTRGEARPFHVWAASTDRRPSVLTALEVAELIRDSLDQLNNGSPLTRRGTSTLGAADLLDQPPPSIEALPPCFTILEFGARG
jgi:hypothetical protein